MRHKSLAPFAVIVTLLLSGCGGGGSAVSAVSKVAASEECINCHSDAYSPGTRLPVVQEYRGSAHARNNGAGCADCHEPAAGHPNVCSKCHGGGGTPTGYEVSRNPDSDGKCAKCHGLTHPTDLMIAYAPQHFGNMTASAANKTTRASYVSGQYVGKCRACHNPHDNTLTPQHRAYVTSAHGDPYGVAWTARDFKASAGCIRCHTTTGFVQYVSSTFTVPTSGFGAGDTSREVLGCNGCHPSYDFKKRRQIPAVTARYGTDAAFYTVSFPDVGESNLCIPCHSGRDSGASISALDDASFGNASAKSSHYRAAAGLMYMKIGFTAYTSPNAPIGSSTYGRSLTPDNLSVPDGGVEGGQSSTHRKFGTPLINGDRHKPAFFVAGVMDRNGPCVTCHLNASGVGQRPASGHSLRIDENAYKQVCINCHTSEGGVALAADGSNFRSVFLEPQSENFLNALRLMKYLLLNNYGISYDGSSFYDENLPLVGGKKQRVTDWTRGGKVNGKKLMGTCFNLHLLNREEGAYAHARTYVRRLIYDGIDFLDDGTINLSVGKTAVASALTNPDGSAVYVKDTTPNGSTTDAMLYLVAGNRNAGTWNTVERP